MDGNDRRWMGRALRLAVASLGQTWPNPGVGCVIARAGRELGAGRHRAYGTAHAEVAALEDCRRRGHDPAGATVYVTLAPCTRTGRTPPCVMALCAARPERVVAAIADPNQDDPGPMLTAAGIAYQVGCRAETATRIHGGFLTRLRTGRPRMTGKWAMTLDGSIACVTGDAAWISCPVGRRGSRRRRRVFDGILVGAATLLRDDPELLALDPARCPVRIIVDPELTQVPRLADLRLWRQPLAAPVWVVHNATAAATAIQVLADHEAVSFPVTDARDPDEVTTALGTAGLGDVLVEGGSRLHGAWLRAGVYDRLELSLGPRTLGGGLPVASGSGVGRMNDSIVWQVAEVPRRCGDSVVLVYARQKTDAS